MPCPWGPTYGTVLSLVPRPWYLGTLVRGHDVALLGGSGKYHRNSLVPCMHVNIAFSHPRADMVFAS